MDFKVTTPPRKVTSPPRKMAKSLPPHDIIVRVGSANVAREFPCHKAVLCEVFEYFDNLIRNTEKINETYGLIEFPTMHPDEWEKIYEFIGPHNLGRRNCAAEISSDNVMCLLPWFHQFGLYDFVEECDLYLVSENTCILVSIVPRTGGHFECHKRNIHNGVMESIHGRQKNKGPYQHSDFQVNINWRREKGKIESDSEYLIRLEK